MTAAKTSLPVLGVPVQSKSAERPRLAAVDRADAGGRAGRHARDRRGGRDQRGAARGRRSCANQHPQIRAALDAFRAAADRQGARAAGPARAARPRHEDRHHRRRPARTHAGPRGLSAGAAIPVPRLERGLAGRPGRRRSSPARSTTGEPRAARRGRRPRHLRVRERAGRRAATPVAQIAPCLPPVEALRVSQDRLLEKELFGRLGSPRRRSAPSTARATCARPSPTLGLPGVLKTRRLGYDGKGQHYLRKPADVEPAWAALGGVPLILEGFVRLRPRGVDHRRAQHARRSARSTRSSPTRIATASCA